MSRTWTSAGLFPVNGRANHKANRFLPAKIGNVDRFDDGPCCVLRVFWFKGFCMNTFSNSVMPKTIHFTDLKVEKNPNVYRLSRNRWFIQVKLKYARTILHGFKFYSAFLHLSASSLGTLWVATSFISDQSLFKKISVYLRTSWTSQTTVCRCSSRKSSLLLNLSRFSSVKSTMRNAAQGSQPKLS